MQEIAKLLIKNGHDVYLLTYRYDDDTIENFNYTFNNIKLHNICSSVGIVNKIFTNHNPKSYYINKFELELHYDDDLDFAKEILTNTNCDVALYSNSSIIVLSKLVKKEINYNVYRNLKKLY